MSFGPPLSISATPFSYFSSFLSFDASIYSASFFKVDNLASLFPSPFNFYLNDHSDISTPVTGLPSSPSAGSLMPELSCIDHPRFKRLSETQYVIINLDSKYNWALHVGQIMNYLAFDQHLRDNGNLSDFTGIPIGYSDFANLFNTGRRAGDGRYLSTCITSSAGDSITPSSNPVYLEDFYITPEQCGLAAPQLDGITKAQAYVFEDYATTQAIRNKRRREAIQAREDKRHSLFGRFGSTRASTHRFDPLAATPMARSTDERYEIGYSSNAATPATPSTSSYASTAHASASSSSENTSTRSVVPTATVASTSAPAVSLPRSSRPKTASAIISAAIGDRMQE
jgi:hypothetical protein